MFCLPIWILVVAYAAHIMEEYFLNWRAWAEKMSKLQLSWTEFFVANAAVIVLGFCCAIVGYREPLFSFIFVGLALVNGLFAHLATTLVTRVFSPGLITSIVLFIPISIWAYVDAYNKNFIDLKSILFTLFAGLIVMGFPIGLQKIKAKLK